MFCFVVSFFFFLNDYRLISPSFLSMCFYGGFEWREGGCVSVSVPQTSRTFIYAYVYIYIYIYISMQLCVCISTCIFVSESGLITSSPIKMGLCCCQVAVSSSALTLIFHIFTLIASLFGLFVLLFFFLSFLFLFSSLSFFFRIICCSCCG
ncbi:hypothetical protein, unlikely [Trypanosoma brucei gambiense DAL972]|uniref:Uncharacterized protein n=1 Tax=Trypanosoma brucei gambiense (strain MHOM/CI/86/DAL972) TaxID=679716 RepID=D0A402_TRYB9|nr:hypothetical protein, unlikely [Trypanosoma brucei gambiense DAL972]CBH15996.1 hypothetical protein, unlikely [Trypanosoma brucei gambiense DAL972]|eukprot:XP_011778260.1 hypothetical protein, unlikely [Trypanosoma brucei gambiense DAL972]